MNPIEEILRTARRWAKQRGIYCKEIRLYYAGKELHYADYVKTEERYGGDFNAPRRTYTLVQGMDSMNDALQDVNREDET